MIIPVTEKEVQRALEKYLVSINMNVTRFLKTPVGVIDIFATEIVNNKEKSYIIEIKNEHQIKRAIGQVESYRQFIPADEYHIVTFNSRLGRKLASEKILKYQELCKSLDIKLFRIEDTNALPFLKKEIGL
jgi:hypothetical protein